MGLIGCPETSVRYYHYSLRNKPSRALLSSTSQWKKPEITQIIFGQCLVRYLLLNVGPFGASLGTYHSAPSERSISYSALYLGKGVPRFFVVRGDIMGLIPFNAVLNFGKRKKPHSVTAGEYGGSVKAAILCLSKNSHTDRAEYANASSWWKKPIHRIEFGMSFSPLVVPQTLW